MNKLEGESGVFAYNVGTGKGYSNKEVVEMIQKVAGKTLQTEIKPRRPGDADILVADISAIQIELGFEPKYSDLETIVKSAYAFHSSATA